MGGKSYYCDYCHNHMKNDVTVRKKHIDGLPHKIAKAEYMAKYRDPQDILNEESKKTPCSRFHVKNECRFGLFCHFGHYTQDQMKYLQDMVMKDNMGQEYNIKNTTVWNYPKNLQPMDNLPPSLRPINSDNLKDIQFETWG